MGQGYIPWVADNGETVYVPCYCSPEVAETIISPTDVVMSHSHLYAAWGQFAHIPTSQGHITFYWHKGTNHAVYPLQMHNGLWYNESPIPQDQPHSRHTNKQHHAITNRLNAPAKYELRHQHSCRCGRQKLRQLHKHVKGISEPLKGNDFWLCTACIHASQTAWAICPSTNTTISQDHKMISTETENELDWLDLVSPVPDTSKLQAR